MSDHAARPGLRRRDFVLAGAGASLALAGPGPLNYVAIARAKKLPVATGGKFAHGVSSGFPSPRAITLWTRVAELERSSRLTLEVATDKHFKHVVKRREVIADAARDFTVHTRVTGLKPAHEYHYRFHTKHKDSRVGRFRTLPPADSNQTLRIGFYSCQSYEAGYFTAQGALAKEKDLDLVLCLGDYIYEHHYYAGPAARVDQTGTNKDGDVQTLAEYREKYRFYQRDKHLQDLHAAYPFVVIWDDHEVEDNYAGSKPASRSWTTAPGRSWPWPRTAPPAWRTTTASRAASRSVSGGPTATGPSTRRCRGSARAGSTVRSGSARWPGCSSPTSGSTAINSPATTCRSRRAQTTCSRAARSSAVRRRPGSRARFRSRRHAGACWPARR